MMKLLVLAVLCFVAAVYAKPAAVPGPMPAPNAAADPALIYARSGLAPYAYSSYSSLPLTYPAPLTYAYPYGYSSYAYSVPASGSLLYY